MTKETWGSNSELWGAILALPRVIRVALLTCLTPPRCPFAQVK